MDLTDKYLNEVEITKPEYIKRVKTVGDAARSLEKAWQEFVGACVSETWEFDMKDKVIRDLDKIEKGMLNNVSKITSKINHTLAMNMKR